MQNMYYIKVYMFPVSKAFIFAKVLCLQKEGNVFNAACETLFGLHSLMQCQPGECHSGAGADLQTKTRAHMLQTHVLFLRTTTACFQGKSRSKCSIQLQRKLCWSKTAQLQRILFSEEI